MAEIIKVYLEEAPQSRFIGIRYGEADRRNHSFSHLWQDWFANSRFALLEPLLTDAFRQSFPEAGSYVGLCRWDGARAMEYWIGLFLPPDTLAPDGFEALDAPAGRLGVCWVKGREPEVYWQYDACVKRLAEEGHSLAKDAEGCTRMMERYQCPRFTEPDAEGIRILDMVFCLA